MATTPRSRTSREVDYPTSDGRPMAETDLHRQVMIDLIETLRDRYAAEPIFSAPEGRGRVARGESPGTDGLLRHSPSPEGAT